jgi:hypothetical protein
VCQGAWVATGVTGGGGAPAAAAMAGWGGRRRAGREKRLAFIGALTLGDDR